MKIESINNTPNNKHKTVFTSQQHSNISYGYLNLKKDPNLEPQTPQATPKDKILALIGALAGVGTVLAALMKHQKIKNPMNVKYNIPEMLTMAAAGNAGGILLSSIGEPKEDKLKKWKEGAFQMILTAVPMLLVGGGVKLCEQSKHLNNNLTKILVSALGVFIGSNTALAASNKLRNPQEAKKPERKLNPVDMVANLDDIITMLILAKIPFASKIHVERLLPFIYTFCGYKSGTGDRR